MTTNTFHRGIRDMKIAAWNGEGSYGTAYDVLGARAMSVEYVMEGDELRGDDVVLDRYSKLISVTVRMEQAAVSFTVLNMLMGGTLVSNADYEDVVTSETTEIPYVALAGRVVGSGGANDLHLFVPKAKVMGNLQFNAQLDTYLIPQVQLQGIFEGAANGIARQRKFTAATALEIPLRTSAGGL